MLLSFCYTMIGLVLFYMMALVKKFILSMPPGRCRLILQGVQPPLLFSRRRRNLYYSKVSQIRKQIVFTRHRQLLSWGYLHRGHERQASGRCRALGWATAFRKVDLQLLSRLSPCSLPVQTPAASPGWWRWCRSPPKSPWQRGWRQGPRLDRLLLSPSSFLHRLFPGQHLAWQQHRRGWRPPGYKLILFLLVRARMLSFRH